MNDFKLIISSPDGNLWDGNVVFLSLRGALGDLAIMAGHIPFVTPILPCEVKIELQDGSEKSGSINDGLLTVTDGCATILSGTFTWK